MAVAKTFKCPVDGCFETDSEQGWRIRMGKQHGGYNREQLQKAGLEENAGDRVRYLSGFKSLDDVRAAAPESEGGAGASPSGQGNAARASTRQPRLSKEELEKKKQEEEFERLRPMLVKKWERRLKTVYGTWARLAGDKSIALQPTEANEGAEMHVEMMIAFGWVHAGKIEAIADLVMWHGSAILARSEIGQQLIRSFESTEDPTTERGPLQ